VKSWFENLDIRERRLIVIAAALLVLLLLYLLVWKPISGEYRRLDTSIKEKEKTVSEMETLAAEVSQLQRNKPRAPVRSDTGGSLLGKIDKTAKANGLGAAVKRVRPDGDNKASVTLEGAEFDRVVVWLENLQRRESINVISNTIEKEKEEGLVSMRIELQESGS